MSTIVSASKIEQVLALGADHVYERNVDIVAELADNAPSVVIDNVGGDNFGNLLKAMKRGGRYASSGAIAGPLVQLDLRTMYLKDITLIGCTAWDEDVFPNLISHIEKNEIRPLIAKTYPLKSIVDAQKEFLLKTHVGKFVLVPPTPSIEQMDHVRSLGI